MKWSGRSVLVTGAGGFIGSHLVEALLTHGAKVRALVHYNSAGSIGNLQFVPPEALREVEIVLGDVRDAHGVRAYVRGTSVVFHLAALIGIPYSYTAPSSYVDTNVTGTLNVLEAARAEGLERVVITSTSETYGTAQRTPIDEAHPAVAQSPYAATKAAADQLALSYHRSFDLPVSVVRPFNTYGPRQSERAILPAIVSQSVFADGAVNLGSLEPRRDLTYVTDTAAGFLTLAGHPDALGRAVNLGAGRSYSVRELVATVGRVLGRELRIVHDPQRVRPERSEVMELCADASLAASLGWTPRVPLEEGIAALAKFIQGRGPEASHATLRYRI